MQLVFESVAARAGRAAFLRTVLLSLVATFNAGCGDDDWHGVGTTTSTSTTTSSTSTTTVPIGGCVDDSECFDVGIDCFCEFSSCHCAASRAELELELVSDVAVGALQLEIGYQSIGDSFVGSGSAVECVSLVASGTFAAFYDHDESRVVGAAFINLAGIGGDGDLGLMRCGLAVGGVLPTASDFTIVVTDASDVDLVPVDPPPLVWVSRIEISGGGFPLR